MAVRLYRYKLLQIVVGCVFAAIGINMFVVPNHLLAGGVSGISIILHYLFGLPIPVMMLLINIPIFIIGFYQLHYGYLMRSLLGLGSLTFFLALTKSFIPVIVIDDLLLAAIFAGLLQGIGYGLIFRGRGSSGGTDIISMILRRKYSVNIGSMNFLINSVIMAVSLAFFDVRYVGYTLISMYISGVVLDKVQLGFDRAQNVFIISDRSKEVADAIMHQIGRGVTVLKGRGAYSHIDKEVLMTSISITQLAKLKDIIYLEDPSAFVMVWEASEVLGKGFKPSPMKERKEMEIDFNLKRWEERFQSRKLKTPE
ncbi:MAG: YitT family protein [Firmicutes bacterium]|nr:YitT family protein [Bacillota bacterium]MDD4263970.1 YitT family protein [Bacillota bacterium]MDD4693032.1 YitT family protein [Bacillota bacterium]